MSKEADLITETLKNMTEQIKLMSSVQMAVVTYLGEKDHNFRNEVIAEVLAVDKFRESFTNFVLSRDDAPDEVKLQMIEINEGINEIKERKDNA
tara:strand:- start:753 stop:1034 length:282 start_codon:yes stop_codon:yes gene_type:complete